MTFGAGNPGRRLPQARARLRAAPGLAAGLAALALGGCIGDPLAGAQPEDAISASAAPSSAAPDADAALAISLAPTQLLQPAPGIFSSQEWALWDGQRTMGGRWIALPGIATSRRVRITNLDTGTATDGALILRDPGLAGPRLIVSSQAAQALGLRPGVAAGVDVVALEFAPPPVPAASVNPVAETLAAAASASADGAPPGPLPVARPVRRAAVPGAPQPAAAPLAPSGRSGPATPPPAPGAPAGATAVATSAAGGAIADGLTYIQAGIFADPANATRLIGRLQAAGLSARAARMQRGSRDLTRVLVGPFDRVEARDRALETVRQIGPADATPVRG